MARAQFHGGNAGFGDVQGGFMSGSMLCFVLKMLLSLGGGFKDVLFSSLLWGFMIQFDYSNIFQRGLKLNHQLEKTNSLLYKNDGF